MSDKNTLLSLSASRLGFVVMSFPAFGTLFVVIWSIFFDFRASTATHCRVPNFLPSISAAIGGFTPQRYIWRICITLHAAPRFFYATGYYNWFNQVHMGSHDTSYRLLVKIAILLHCIENFVLVTLTSVSSSENLHIHEGSFILFIICSQFYMALTCLLCKWVRDSTGLRKEPQDNLSYKYKKILAVFNISCFLFATYLYFRHNWYCEPYVYSWFALCEYMTVFSNILFHGTATIDMRDYSFGIVLSDLLHKFR